MIHDIVTSTTTHVVCDCGEVLHGENRLAALTLWALHADRDPDQHTADPEPWSGKKRGPAEPDSAVECARCDAEGMVRTGPAEPEPKR